MVFVVILLLMIEEFVVGENGEVSGMTYLTSDSAFYEEIENLKKHVEERKNAVLEYLE